MYRWCSYCQGFLGETEPRNDYKISHGICQSCKPRLSSQSDTLVSLAKPMKEFFTSIRKDLLARTNRDPSTLLKQAKDLGIAPFDVLAGIMQPLLYEIAQLQNDGQAIVSQEADFSVMVDGFFLELEKARAISKPYFASKVPNVVIACAEGNAHVFGARLIAEYFLKEGVFAKCLIPSRSFHDVISFALDTRVKIIGISVMTEEQTRTVIGEWQKHIQAASEKNTPTLVLGGLGVSSSMKLPDRTHAHTGNLNELKTLVEVLLRSQAA